MEGEFEKSEKNKIEIHQQYAEEINGLRDEIGYFEKMVQRLK